ncbi:MAG TPA: hypothetical protein VGH10_12845 [Actinomycetota bacterium]|jgi:hypothetical protein
MYVRWALLIAGILLVAVGAVWIFQGVGVIKGSFMTNDSVWAWIGLGCVVAGVVALARGFRPSGVSRG